MAIQPYLFTTFIPGSACIGDSRTTINASFSALDTAIQNLSTGSVANINVASVVISSTNVTVSGDQLPFTVVGNSNNSVYSSIQNTFAGVSASTDISIYNDGGTNYLDLGINSSTYNGNSYSPKFNIVGSGDSYLYSTANDLAIGTSATGANNDLIFFTGGSLSGTSVNGGNERMRITNTGGSYSGNVGINTSFPNQQLTVNGAISATTFVATSSLWVGSLSATTGSPGTVVAKMPIYNAVGSFVGFIPVYNS